MQDKHCTNKYLKFNVTINSKCKHKINYIIAGQDKEADMKICVKITESIHEEFDNIFVGIGCFKVTFLLQVRGRLLLGNQ